MQQTNIPSRQGEVVYVPLKIVKVMKKFLVASLVTTALVLLATSCEKMDKLYQKFLVSLKKSNTMKTFILGLSLVVLAHAVNAQFGRPPSYSPGASYMLTAKKKEEKVKKVHDGIVFLEDGGEIKGAVKFSQNGKVKVKTENNSTFTVVENAIKVRLFEADTNLIPQNYTDYFYLKIEKTPKWYRQVVDGKVSLYDQTTYCNEVPNYFNIKDLVIRQGDAYESTFNFWSTSYKADLVKAMNRVFNTNFRTKDFKTKKELIDTFRALASN
jgi:hypothetical protein